MAIQYSGSTPSNTTFTNTTGTAQEIVTGLQNALIAGGWTCISGLNTATVLMQSATTPSPQSLTCRVQLFTPGGSVAAQVQFRNVSASKVQTNYVPLFPGVGTVWRVICNAYQFFIFTAASATVSRQFGCGGVPYIPSFLQGIVTECIWCHGSGGSSTDTVLRGSFRTGLTTGVQNNQGAVWVDCNGNTWENFNAQTNNQSTGWLQLATQCGTNLAPSTGTQPWPTYQWHDGSLLVYEPLVAWGLGSITDQPMFRGQLWDCAVISDAFAADQTTTFDTRNWWVITNNNLGTTGTYARGSLLHVTP